MFVDQIDFDHPLFWTVDEVFTTKECGDLIQRIDKQTFEVAPVNRADGPEVDTRLRNNSRVIMDDHELGNLLFERIRQHLPTRLHGWKMLGANERFRCYRYEPGQGFGPHYDGSFRRSENECSMLTVMLYLNEGFEGGETAFLDLDEAIVPRTGSVLLFQHAILHEGCEVTNGVKYAIRTDVMYGSK